LDLVVTAAVHDNAVFLVPGKGDGTFESPRVRSGAGLRPVGLAVGHFNGDGRPDLVTANSRAGTVSVLLNRPAAPFLAATAALQALDPDGMTWAIHVSAVVPGARAELPETGYSGSIHFHSTDPRAELPEAYTFTPADQGTHSFHVKFRTPGYQTVTARDAA